MVKILINSNLFLFIYFLIFYQNLLLYHAKGQIEFWPLLIMVFQENASSNISLSLSS